MDIILHRSWDWEVNLTNIELNICGHLVLGDKFLIHLRSHMSPCAIQDYLELFPGQILVLTYSWWVESFQVNILWRIGTLIIPTLRSVLWLITAVVLLQSSDPADSLVCSTLWTVETFVIARHIPRLSSFVLWFRKQEIQGERYNKTKQNREQREFLLLALLCSHC